MLQNTLWLWWWGWECCNGGGDRVTGNQPGTILGTLIKCTSHLIRKKNICREEVSHFISDIAISIVAKLCLQYCNMSYFHNLLLFQAPPSPVLYCTQTYGFDSSCLFPQAAQADDPSKAADSVVIVTIEDMNDNAPVFSQQNISVFILENSPVDAVVAMASVADADQVGANHSCEKLNTPCLLKPGLPEANQKVGTDGFYIQNI